LLKIGSSPMLQAGDVQLARKLAVPGLFAVTVAFWGVVAVDATDRAKLWLDTQVTGMLVSAVPFESVAVATSACVPLFARLNGAVPPLELAMLNETSGQVLNGTAGLLVPLAEA
jgi:hypothetical protein